ncbi:MAG: SUMF1/EgtB/PvdO family nonheme iron enzyme [Opitutaceae bacterium]|nr:SUMF1/EgtB/PvdO family nonheme iron enzyme [Opitutaceae bacterium]
MRFSRCCVQKTGDITPFAASSLICRRRTSMNTIDRVFNTGGVLLASVVALVAVTTTTAQSVSIDFVTVGYLGNPSDSNGRGSVNYQYQIGKFEVTNTQYAAFLNAVAKTDTYNLYSSEMGSSQFGGISRAGSAGSYTYEVKSGFGNKPVVFVSFWDAARFTNWLHNGQGSGDTETGAYTLGGVANPVFSAGIRTTSASVFLPSKDEWHKAAYYDPTKDGTGAYWEFPTTSNELSGNTVGTAQGANFFFGGKTGGVFANYGPPTYAENVGPGTVDVGAYPAPSFFGTFDQGGNVWEWNDSDVGGNFRGLRGGAWDYALSTLLSNSADLSYLPQSEDRSTGFRVASLAPIPEPSTYAAIVGLVSLGVATWRRRAGRGNA